MKYIVWMSVCLWLAGCAYLPGHDDPVEWQKVKPVTQSSNKNMDHKNSFFVAQKAVQDGYVFIFHVMPAPEGKGYSRSLYHLMVSIEKDNKQLTDLVISARVKHPNGTVEENASMMQMGDWYMSLHNLNHEKGQHWITVSFEQGGKTYSSGIYYPERAYHE